MAFYSCDNIGALDCFKTTGEIVEEEVFLDAFHAIEALDEVDVYLFHSTEQKVVIKAGRNLIPKIDLNVEEGILSVENRNSCNWRRSPENPGIYIYSDQIDSIAIFDYANIYAQPLLDLENLRLYSDGTGNFDMHVDIDSLYIESVYISNFRLEGSARFLSIEITDDSKILAKNLTVDYIEIDHNGSNGVEVFPVKSLAGVLESTGNLYFYHAPEELDITVRSSGKVVDMSR